MIGQNRKAGNSVSRNNRTGEKSGIIKNILKCGSITEEESDYGTLLRVGYPDFQGEVLVDKRNDRIRVLCYQAADIGELVDFLDSGARLYGVGKVIVYAYSSDWRQFLKRGYRLEGVMSGYYRGEPSFCMSSFIKPGRLLDRNTIDEDLILKRIINTELREYPSEESADYKVRPASLADTEEIRKMFIEVFATYPSPLENPSYLEQLIVDDTYLFRIAEIRGKIAGIAAADINPDCLCAEITDCVVRPDHRGNGLMGRLVDSLEKDLAAMGLIYLFTLARAGIPQINAVFNGRGYFYGGKLVNNCDIGGRFENMNIWEKVLDNG